MALKDLKHLWEAIDAFNQEGLEIVKDTKVSFGQTNYTHAKLDDILQEIDPFLRKHGLFITHFPGTSDQGEPALIMVVRHLPSDEQFETLMVLPLTKKDPQAAGSSITYYRRYSIGAVLKLHLVEDDDAHVATFPDPVPVRAKQEPAPIHKQKPTGFINEKARMIVLKEILDAKLSEEQNTQLKDWMSEKKLTLLDPTNVTDGDLEGIYKKLSELIEPI